MAENKKGFILYADQKELFDQLPDDKAGELIKHIFSYVNDENPVTDDLVIKLAFTPIKQQFKRDLQKWESTREARSKAGKASAEARKLKKEQELTNSTHVKSVEQNPTNPTVNDNVTVNVNDTVKVKDILISSVSDETSLTENQSITISFWKLFKTNAKASGISKTTTLDRAKLNNWCKHIDTMVNKDGRTIEEIRIVWNFLNSNTHDAVFWKPNIQSTNKLKIQFEKLYFAATKPSKEKNKNGAGVDADYLQELKERMYGKSN